MRQELEEWMHEMESAASAATPGPWKSRESATGAAIYSPEPGGDGRPTTVFQMHKASPSARARYRPNARYAETFHPDTLKKLLAIVRAAGDVMTDARETGAPRIVSLKALDDAMEAITPARRATGE